MSEKVHRTLAELGVGDEAGVEALIRELRSALDADLAAIKSPDNAEQARVRWLGRKQGLLGAANDKWLASAPGPLKRAVGRGLNTLKAHAEQGLEERRKAVAEKRVSGA